MMPELYQFLSGPTLAWMPFVTLLFLLTWHPWEIYSPIGSLADLSGKCATVLVFVGLLMPAFRVSPWLWLAIAGSHFGWIAAAYHAADNHQYLIGYWCVAVFVALLAGGEAGSAILAQSGVLLIGLCFAFAVGAKLASRRYRDGSVFTYLLLLDGRFSALATLLGGVTPEERERHRAAAGRVRAGESLSSSVPIAPRLQAVAVALTWWTVGIESLVAASFLLPLGGINGLRPAVAGAFVLSTYLFVSVPAFGQILLIMLMATVDDVTLRSVTLIAAIALTPMSFLPQSLMRLAASHYNMILSRAPAPEPGTQSSVPAGIGG